MRIRWSRGAPI